MYLSRLILDPRSREVRCDLADCQGLHRTLMRAFPDGDGDATAVLGTFFDADAHGRARGARARMGLLYRVEVGRDGSVRVLTQSRERPDWGRLSAGYLAGTGGQQPNPDVKDAGGAYAALATGMRLRFRLRANATKRLAHARDAAEQEWVGKRVDLRREEDQLAWLRRKAEASGFELARVQARADVPNVRTVAEDRVIGRRGPGAGGGRGRLTFGSVLFEGELVVQDGERLREALATGIGPGKAYGFGLLSVAPA